MKKISFANQLLEFEKPYINIGDNSITESFVVKDNNQALLISSVMQPNKHTEHMTYDELLNFISKSNSLEEQTYYVYLDGSIPLDESRLYQTEDEIYHFIHSQLEKNIKDFREYQQNHTDNIVSQYLRDNPWFLNYAEQSIANFDSSLVDFNIGIGDDSPLLIVRINKGNITIQGIVVTFVRKNDFKVDIYDIPITKYTLEQLKYVPKINVSKEPRIPLRLNPGITRQDIKEAKQMIRDLRR